MSSILTRIAKRSLPTPAKGLAAASLRAWGELTATWRPVPDFLIIGTKRGGTTSLWNYLLDHPGVLPMFPAALDLKSPHYFYWHYDEGPRWYRSHFATIATRSLASWRLRARAVTGEASPNYLHDPRVPQRVRELIPQARIIVLLRDPVERAYSHYKERVRAGTESLSFEEALAAEPDRLSGEVERMLAEPYYYSQPHDHYAYRTRGLYLAQIRRWAENFPRSSLLIIRSEDFYADPDSAYADVTDFLGLSRFPLKEAKRFNFKPARDMDADTRRELTEFYAPHNRELEQYLGREFGWGVQ